MCPERCAQTIEDGSVDKAIAPVAFRGISLKYTPDQLLVCAIPGPRATAKMACVNNHRLLCSFKPRQRNFSPVFSVPSVLKGFRALQFHSNPKTFNTEGTESTEKTGPAPELGLAIDLAMWTHSPSAPAFRYAIFAWPWRKAHPCRKNWFWWVYYPKLS